MAAVAKILEWGLLSMQYSRPANVLQDVFFGDPKNFHWENGEIEAVSVAVSAFDRTIAISQTSDRLNALIFESPDEFADEELAFATYTVLAQNIDRVCRAAPRASRVDSSVVRAFNEAANAWRLPSDLTPEWLSALHHHGSAVLLSVMELQAQGLAGDVHRRYAERLPGLLQETYRAMVVQGLLQPRFSARKAVAESSGAPELG